MGSCTASSTFNANVVTQERLKAEATLKKTESNLKLMRMNTMTDNQKDKLKNDIPASKNETFLLQTVNVMPKAVTRHKSKFTRPLNIMDLHEYTTSDICCIMSSKNNCIETLVPFISLDISKSSLQQRRSKQILTPANI